MRQTVFFFKKAQEKPQFLGESYFNDRFFYMLNGKTVVFLLQYKEQNMKSYCLELTSSLTDISNEENTTVVYFDIATTSYLLSCILLW